MPQWPTNPHPIEKEWHQGRDVFSLNTCGFESGLYFDATRKITRAKQCQEVGSYQCLGYDTFGPFKLVGGTAKGHPDEADIAGAVEFSRKSKADDETRNWRRAHHEPIPGHFVHQ